MAERKHRFAVLSKFEAYWKEKRSSELQINKYKEQWAADALLESFSMEKICEAMEYYFSINSSPSWKGFANNIERLIQSKTEKEEDERLRAERRVQAKEWLSG